MIFASLLSIALSFFIIKLYKRWRLAAYLKSKFAHPPTYPIFGSLLNFPTDPVYIFPTIQNYFKTLNKNWLLIRLFFDPLVVISDRKDIETILSDSNSKAAKKSDDYLTLVPWLGTGLLTAWGDKWYQHRKIITPSFHFTILERFTQIFNRQTDILVEKIKPLIGKGDFDIYNMITLFTLDVICEASMGTIINAQSQPDLEYVLAVKEISTIVHKRSFHIFKDSDLLWNLTSLGRRQNKLIKCLNKFTNDVIVERRNTILKQNNDCVNDKYKNFLDMLLHATIDGKPLTNDDIREEVETFVFEGHDTTASGIAFTLYQLSQNQEVQERVFKELQSVFSETDVVTSKNLSELKYMEMVIKETLRILPSVPYIARKLSEEITIDGTVVPVDTNITISIYALHHDPDNFADPEKFDPERFADSTRYPFAYVPFSAGARNCIGQKFAMLEIKSVITKIILNYKLLPNENVKELQLQGDLILKSANGVYLQLESRH